MSSASASLQALKSMNSIQVFGPVRQLEPLRLNSTAVKYNFDGTDFLAFNKPLSSQPVVEFAHAESPVPYNWEGVWPGKLRVKQTDPMLVDTFAKPGVFNFRYKDVANPIAYGSDFQYDFGSGRPGPGVIAAERATGDTAAMYDDPMPPPVRRQMIFTEKIKEKMKAYNGPVANPPEHAYENYGYKETTTWTRNGASQSSAEKTRVMSNDSVGCEPNDSWVDGQCFAGQNAVASCPPGYRYHDDGQCHRDSETASSLPASSSTLVLERAGGSAGGSAGGAASLEDITKKKCPPGWAMRNGQCFTQGQIRNLHF